MIDTLRLENFLAISFILAKKISKKQAIRES